jgi:hypothetical protein
LLENASKIKVMKGADLGRDSPIISPPQVIKLNGRDPSKEKKVISFNPVEDNALIGGTEHSSLPMALRNARPPYVKDQKSLRDFDDPDF